MTCRGVRAVAAWKGLVARSAFAGALLPGLWWLFLAVALAGCSPRGELRFAGDAAGTGTMRDIWVATNRVRAADGLDFSSERSRSLTFAHYGVSVPPTHAPGNIEWARNLPDPERHFVTVGTRTFDREAFLREINAAFRALPRDERTATIYIHGYNNNFSESLYRATQIKHDFDIAGVQLLFSWPSEGRNRGYVHDRDSVVFSRSQLQETLNLLARSEANRIVVIAHSLGAYLASDVMREMALTGDVTLDGKLQGIIYIAPDIDLDVFKSQLENIDPLPQPFVIFVNESDFALRLSRLLTHGNVRLGMVDDIDQLADLPLVVVDVSVYGKDKRTRAHQIPATSKVIISMLAGRRILLEMMNGDVLPITTPGSVSTETSGAATRVQF